MDNQALIETRDIWKVYGEGSAAVHALQSVSITIDEGDFLLILGPSGCGKSTLLHMLGLLDSPDKGDVIWRGRKTVDLSTRQLTKMRLDQIGFVFQSFNLLTALSVFDNVAIVAKAARVPGSIRRQKVLTQLTELGLEQRWKNKVSQLSGGEKQRVAIARAMVNDPEVILADEPTGNLDSRNSQIIFDLLKRLNRQGRTIIMVTHDERYADETAKVIQMKDGKPVNL